jgi:hypothetical protein
MRGSINAPIIWTTRNRRMKRTDNIARIDDYEMNSRFYSETLKDRNFVYDAGVATATMVLKEMGFEGIILQLIQIIAHSRSSVSMIINSLGFHKTLECDDKQKD